MPPKKKADNSEESQIQTNQAEPAIRVTNSSANTGRKYQHRPLIESSYGETRALQDPDAYLKYLCSTMVSRRPWLEFDDVYRHLKCVCTRHSTPVRAGAGCLNNSQGKPSHQVIADFPMSHRCFLTFNRLLDWLKGCFSNHKDWREAVSKHGELPFEPELFTRGFFAARVALGHGYTRFTLLGGPKEKGWTKAIEESKLGYLNHEPNTPQGEVPEFWAGFFEHQSANWGLKIKPAADKAKRIFEKNRKTELKRKREHDADEENQPKRPSSKDVVKAQNEFIATAMKRLAVTETANGATTNESFSLANPETDSSANHTQPATKDQEVSDQAKVDTRSTNYAPASSVSKDVHPVNLERVHDASNALNQIVFNPSAFMHQPEGHSKPQTRPAKIDMKAAKAARNATKSEIKPVGNDVAENDAVYDNVSGDGRNPDSSNKDNDKEDIEAVPRKTMSNNEDKCVGPRTSPSLIKKGKTPEIVSSGTATKPPTTTKSQLNLSTRIFDTPSNKTTKTVRRSPGVTAQARNLRSQRLVQCSPARADAQDGEESDSSVTVGFPTPVRKRI